MLGVLLLAAGLRLWGLPDLGFRYADEGTYALFGMEMLKGSRGFIYYKPGHAALTWVALNAFGVSTFSPMLLSALLGVASVLLLYLLTRELYGTDAGLVSATCAVAMPYLLYYHRSALSEGNYVFLDLAGLYLSLLGLRTRRWGLFAAAGAAWALAYDVKPQAGLIPIGMALGLLCATRRNPPGTPLDPRLTRIFLVVSLLAALFAHAALASFMRPFMDERAASGVLRSYVQRFFDPGMLPGFQFFSCLLIHGGVAVTLLFAMGFGLAVRRRSLSDVVCLAMVTVTAAYSFRVNVPMPRFHLTFALPVALLAGAGGARVAAVVGRKIGHRAALIALLLALLCLETSPALKVLQMKPGYREACEWLRREERLTTGATTHSWPILAAGTGRPWAIASDVVADALMGHEGDKVLALRLIPAIRRDGYSHLMLDYAIWARLRPEGEANLRRFVADHPPTRVIPNDYLWHPQTLAEGELPGRLAREPLAQNIFIWRLRDWR